MNDTTTGTPVAGSAARAASPTATDWVLAIADDALVYSQRLAEWLTNAPELEEDMALGNLSLDLLGQARALLTHVGELDGTGRSEDDLAMFRDERQFRNVHLVEQERGDFAHEMARLLWFSAHRRALLLSLAAGSADELVRAVAEKGLKETRYHLDHARRWVDRLGDGTPESRRRLEAALAWVAPYVDELFDDEPVAMAAVEAGVLPQPPSQLRPHVEETVAAVLAEATLEPADAPRWRSRDGRAGIHSRPMGYLLAEMQHIARSHPGAAW